jgi:hypothetical protein
MPQTLKGLKPAQNRAFCLEFFPLSAFCLKKFCTQMPVNCRCVS